MVRRLLWLVPSFLLGLLIYLGAAALRQGERPQVPPPSADGTQFPLTIHEPGGRNVVIPKRPMRIVATNSGMADNLAALVDIDRITAVPSTVDEFAGAAQFFFNHPEITRFDKATAEALLSMKPDLVLWCGFQEEGAVRFLEERGIPVLRFDFYKSFADMRKALITVGTAVGEAERAHELAEQFDRRMREVEKAVGGQPRPRVLSYSNYGTGYAVGAGESQDEILRRAGAVNAAAEAGLKGHVTINFEQIIKIDPDWLVVSGDKGVLSPQAQVIMNEPALRNIRAVKEGRIAVVPDRFYSNINHHVATAVEILARQLHATSYPEAAPVDKVPPGHL